MSLQEFYCQIDVRRVDIHLADSNMRRPYIYVAIDESRQILAAKIYDASTPHNYIDFDDHVVKEKKSKE
jgi:hypothetical protein